MPQTDVNGDPRYYVLDHYSHDGFAYYDSTDDDFVGRIKHDTLAGIVDAEAGIIAWAHHVHADRIVEALNRA